MGGGAGERLGVDLTDPASFAAGFPHDVFARLRADAPVWFHRPGAGMTEGFWVVSRHADCLAAARSAELHAAHRAGRAALDGMADGRHRGLRKLLEPALSAAAMRGVEDEVRWTADQLVAGAVRRGGADVVAEIATVLAFQTMARVLGVPSRDRRALFELVTVAFDDGNHDADAAHDAIRSYGRKLIGKKRTHPGADLLSKAIHAHMQHDSRDDHLDQAEVLRLFDLLVTAGIDTTRDAIAAGALVLAEHPEQWDVVRRDRSQLRHATEEILRWASPTPCDWRFALADVELAGQPIAAGDRVTLWWASANRDEAVFVDAAAFDARRDPNPHLAFGHGPYACVGAALARLQLRLVLDVLLDHAAGLHLVGPVEWLCGSEHSSLRRVDVSFSSRGS